MAEAGLTKVECPRCQGAKNVQWMGPHDIEVESCFNCQGTGFILECPHHCKCEPSLSGEEYCTGACVGNCINCQGEGDMAQESMTHRLEQIRQRIQGWNSLLDAQEVLLNDGPLLMQMADDLLIQLAQARAENVRLREALRDIAMNLNQVDDSQLALLRVAESALARREGETWPRKV